MTDSRTLFQPIVLGDIGTLNHRVAMAPLTRFRANDEHEHTELAVEYYTQRCTVPGTLIITEATFLNLRAGGYPNVPAIDTPGQIAAWKKIVDAVHAKGCFLVMQLWALGRAGVKDVLAAQGGFDVVSAGDQPFKDGAVPRPLTEAEIAAYVVDYAQAAKNFVEGAGGDGVEIHSANGYLIDQFLQLLPSEYARNDKYGGSVENRCRFGLEVTAAVVAAVGPKKTGIRLSPYSQFQGMKMPMDDIKSTFSHYVSELKAAHPEMAYIHVVESRIAGNTTIDAPAEEEIEFLYKLWSPSKGGRVFLVAGGFDTASGIKEADDRADTVVVFGRYFISNPDLPSRIKLGQELTPYDRSTFYLYGPIKTGYTTYGPYGSAVPVAA